MGATLITVRSTGTSMRDAYNNAVEEAIYEYGNDNYNGTISTTRGCTDVTKEFVKSGKNLDEFEQYLYENNRLNKWGDALGICVSPPISNNNKIARIIYNSGFISCSRNNICQTRYISGMI